jgi:hypothetical protein
MAARRRAVVERWTGEADGNGFVLEFDGRGQPIYRPGDGSKRL